MDTVKVLGKRTDALNKQLESAATESVFWPVIESLMALRGVDMLTATIIVAEIGDLKRFATAPQLMAYLGLVPSEYPNFSSCRSIHCVPQQHAETVSSKLVAGVK